MIQLVNVFNRTAVRIVFKMDFQYMTPGYWCYKLVIYDVLWLWHTTLLNMSAQIQSETSSSGINRLSFDGRMNTLI